MDQKETLEKIKSAIETTKNTSFLSKFLAAISYVGVFCFVPLVVKVKDEGVNIHARQGMVLFLAEIIFTLIWVIPFIGWIVGFIGWIFCIIVSLIGFIQSLSGRLFTAPFIHYFADKIKII
ncbi:MAG: hypothetical protein PHG83_03880 [Patescibacteria group bacterium]|jgi:uncharacterized membrane protein|nr:hypothetical protein [Patescibacteria group bacterium]